MDYKEFSGKTVDEALTNASVSLGVTSDCLNYEVVEKGSNGFLGFASKDAVIRVNLKNDEVTETPESNEISEVNEVVEKKEVSAKSSKDQALSDEDLENVILSATTFLNDLFKAMQLEVELTFDYDSDNNCLNIDLAGPEMGVVIGKRGQTLDSLQYLTNLAVNRKSSSYVRVKVDTEDYRERRKETLENLAHNVAYKVKRTKHPVSLESMNPYERRIIHAALSDDDAISTHSEGEEPYRHVVVTLK